MIFFESYKNERFSPTAAELITRSILAILRCMYVHEIKKTNKKVTDLYLDSTKWEIRLPNIGKQRDCFNCGFYTLLNIKYALFEILPPFNDTDIEQIKTGLFYEFTRPTLFPLLDRSLSNSTERKMLN
ncbi:hypothetical protein SNEBB_006254 [Seison nebaliae]|nr:hypothetical protein SNEBB_006254 [Seison nebaliae]